MDKFKNIHGLINPSIKDVVSENCPLTTLVYLIILPNTLEYEDLKRELNYNLLRWYRACKTPVQGLFDQHPLPYFNNDTNDDYMSPDQLITMCLYFYSIGATQECERIYRRLRRWLYTYDNVNKKINFKRIMQPQAILAAAYCAGKSWPKYPLYLSMRSSCKRPPEDTSGKQKAFMICKVLGFDKYYKKLNKITNLQDDLIYYYTDDDVPEVHPIITQLEINGGSHE